MANPQNGKRRSLFVAPAVLLKRKGRQKTLSTPFPSRLIFSPISVQGRFHRQSDPLIPRPIRFTKQVMTKPYVLRYRSSITRDDDKGGVAFGFHIRRFIPFSTEAWGLPWCRSKHYVLTSEPSARTRSSKFSHQLRIRRDTRKKFVGRGIWT